MLSFRRCSLFLQGVQDVEAAEDTEPLGGDVMETSTETSTEEEAPTSQEPREEALHPQVILTPLVSSR